MEVKSNHYCLPQVYGLEKEFSAKNFFKWTFCKSPEGSVMLAYQGNSKVPLAMEITSLVVGLGAIAGAATAGAIFLKPVIEQAVTNVMADAAAAEVLKQVASISTIVVGSAVIGTLAYIGIKHAIAAIIVAVNESDAKGKQVV